MHLAKRFQVQFRRATTALHEKNFRYFITGQLISYTGVWINNIAMSWLVYKLTGSAAMLGLVAFASQFPTFLIAPLAGVQVDRMNRKRVLQITIALSALQSALLAVLTITNVITVPQLIILGIAQAVIDGFYIPARQAFIPELITDRAILGNAIALNSASFHFARLIGPAIGGVLILFIGEGGCFLLDALSYGAVLFSLLFITPQPSLSTRQIGTIIQDLSDGLGFIRLNPRVRLLLSYVSFLCLVGIAHTVLLPVLVRDIYQGYSNLLGVLVGCSGLGSLFGAIALALKNNEAVLIKRMQLSGVGFALSVLLLSFALPLPITMLCLIACGFCFITIAAGANTLIQTSIPDHYRGRVMSFFTMSFTGMMPIGAIGAGWLAEHVGILNALLSTGLFAAIGGLLFFLAIKKVTVTE